MNSVAAEELAWDAACRWRQYEAELRVNLVRVAAIGVFYSVHLVHHLAATGRHPVLEVLGLDAGAGLSDHAHVAVTCIAVAWAMLGLLIHRLLLGRVFPRWLMYASTGTDLLLLTCVLSLTSGVTSPLVAGYFLIVMMAGLRLDARLVRCTTATAVIGYVVLLGMAKWPLGLAKLSPLPTVPRYQQLMMIAALVLAGVLVGQWVRSARDLAQHLIRAAREEAAS